MRKISSRKKIPEKNIVFIRRDRRYTRKFVRQILVQQEKIIKGKFNYNGKQYSLYSFEIRGKKEPLHIFLNEHKGHLGICEQCHALDGFRSIGGCFCSTCRERAGNCMLCKRNRLDCCC